MRVWKNNAPDDGSIHCLGNGHLCAYAQGPDLIQVFGPPYSSPAFYQVSVAMDGSLEVHSERRSGTAIWTHHLFMEGQAVGQMVDFVDAELPCLVRQVQVTAPLHLRFTFDPPVSMVDNDSRMNGARGGVLCEIPSGRYFYHVYPYPLPVYHQLAWKGPVTIERRERETQFDIVCGAGECLLFFVGGRDYPQVIQNTETILAFPFDSLLERTWRYWRAFTASRTDFDALLPQSLPQRERLLQAVDDVAVLLKTQQAAEGAVLAGHNYHMGYVRDQYGVSRGLLALGHIPEARRILEFYWEVWQHYGRLHNAQAAGVDGAFHVHENDEVEITGYLVRQAFDLLARSGDEDFTRTIFPMLAWAWQAQKKHLVDGMLPFNGDETYVAGGILPRHTLNDGSAEATLLLIDGGEKLLDWAERRRVWPANVIAGERTVLDAVRGRYRQNFWQDGRLVTNNPARAAAAALPRFRHGVCEKCAYEGHARGIVWTKCSPAGRYLCPECLASGPFPAAAPRRYVLQSVSLTPLYFGSSLFSASELTPLVEEIVANYQRTGRLPSRPDDERAGSGALAVGYDYGLLLYALTALSHPAASDLYEKTLSLLDPVGAWVEYYLDHRPAGTRYRPWESAINLEALLYYGMHLNPKGLKDP
jgi:hypothetical protein